MHKPLTTTIPFGFVVGSHFFDQAECNMKMRRYYEALADAGKSLKIEKELIPALLARAIAYYQLLEYDMVRQAWTIWYLGGGSSDWWW